MATDKSSDNFFDGHWMREATPGEAFFEDHHLKAHLLTCYRLDLKSKSPLKEEDIRLALTYLYRKCTCLQFCFGFKDGKRWLRRSTNPQVDFQVFHGREVREVRECLQSYRYSSETGPLFCARLLLDAPDPLPDLDDLEPHSYHKSILLFGLHHGVGDGTTNMYIMKYFVSLLNNVISKKVVNLDEPLGILIGKECIEAEIDERVGMLMNDQNVMDQLTKRWKKSDAHSPYIITAFPRGKQKLMTHTLEYIVDPEITAKFFNKCREEKVTINSGFSAASNVALVDLVQENGIMKNSYILQNDQIINLRRYWKKQTPNSLGVHLGPPLKVFSEVPRDVGMNYWNLARSLHEAIYFGLKEKTVLMDVALEALEDSPMREPSEDGSSFTTDFCISNLGDVTPLVTEGGEEVRITHITRSTSNHLVGKCPMSIICHTFRGKFTMTLDYNAAALEKEFIDRFCQQIVKRMRDV